MFHLILNSLCIWPCHYYKCFLYLVIGRFIHAIQCSNLSINFKFSRSNFKNRVTKLALFLYRIQSKSWNGIVYQGLSYRRLLIVFNCLLFVILMSSLLFVLSVIKYLETWHRLDVNYKYIIHDHKRSLIWTSCILIGRLLWNERIHCIFIQGVLFCSVRVDVLEWWHIFEVCCNCYHFGAFDEY